jgi:hypothetical protein
MSLDLFRASSGLNPSSALGRKQRIGFVLVILLGFFSSLGSARAGDFEFSAMASYQQSSYGDHYSTRVSRAGVSLGYFFLSQSELEFSFQDIHYKNELGVQENTVFHDQIYSLQWVQAFLPSRFWVQPYLKLGIGQLNREASGVYAGGGIPSVTYHEVTAVGGLGLKLRFSKTFGVKLEGATYLVGGRIATWRDNFGVSGGFSIFF